MNRANLAAGPSSTSDDDECDAEFCKSKEVKKNREIRDDFYFKTQWEFNCLILIGKNSEYKKKLMLGGVRELIAKCVTRYPSRFADCPIKNMVIWVN